MVFDLTPRERETYADKYRKLAEAASTAAQALDDNDDSGLLIQLLIIGITNPNGEVAEALKKAHVKVPDTP